jgi:hypothetical protein
VRGEDGEIVLEFPLAEALVDPGDVKGKPTKH